MAEKSQKSKASKEGISDPELSLVSLMGKGMRVGSCPSTVSTTGECLVTSADPLASEAVCSSRESITRGLKLLHLGGSRNHIWSHCSVLFLPDK